MGQPRGFHPNARGWWHRDRYGEFADSVALGSVLSELLVRAGVKNIALIDEDVLESCNVDRHVATLVDVGKSKVPVIALRLRQISPSVRVAEFRETLPSDQALPLAAAMTSCDSKL